jgi:hypothetical protein
MRPAAVNEIVEIDCQERRTRPDTGFACVAGIKLHVGRGNYILPAVILELVDRRHRIVPSGLIFARIP